MSIKNIFARRSRPDGSRGRGGVWTIVDYDAIRKQGKIEILRRSQHRNEGFRHFNGNPCDSSSQTLISPSSPADNFTNEIISTRDAKGQLDNWVLRLPTPRVKTGQAYYALSAESRSDPFYPSLYSSPPQKFESYLDKKDESKLIKNHPWGIESDIQSSFASNSNSFGGLKAFINESDNSHFEQSPFVRPKSSKQRKLINFDKQTLSSFSKNDCGNVYYHTKRNNGYHLPNNQAEQCLEHKMFYVDSPQIMVTNNLYNSQKEWFNNEEKPYDYYQDSNIGSVMADEFRGPMISPDAHQNSSSANEQQHSEGN